MERVQKAVCDAVKQTVEKPLQANLLIFATAQDYKLGEGRIMTGNHAIANGLTAAWIIIGNIWMFGGLLLKMQIE